MSLDCAIHVLQNEQAEGEPPREVPTDRGIWMCPSFTCQSASYRVDILANNGAGWCECIDFATRRQPNLDAGMTTLTEETTCIHLRKVHRFFNRRLFAAMAKEDAAR